MTTYILLFYYLFEYGKFFLENSTNKSVKVYYMSLILKNPEGQAMVNNRLDKGNIQWLLLNSGKWVLT